MINPNIPQNGDDGDADPIRANFAAAAALETAYNAHAADTSNPHGVTAAQVGAPSGSGTCTGTNTGDQPPQVFVQQTTPTFTTGTPAMWWELNVGGTLKTLWVFDGTP